jgi:hypothetical protein
MYFKQLYEIKNYFYTSCKSRNCTNMVIISGWSGWKLALFVGTIIPLTMFGHGLRMHFRAKSVKRDNKLMEEAGKVSSHSFMCTVTYLSPMHSLAICCTTTVPNTE